MNAGPSVLFLGAGLAWACLALAGCTSHADHREEQTSPKVENFDQLQWLDNRRTSPAGLRPTLDRIAIQEGGEWSGPYNLKELEERLPAALQSGEYRRWVSAFYRPGEVDYYVVSKIGPNSYRTQGGIVDTLGRFPVCVFTASVMQNGSSYRRFVFNATGSDRTVP